MTCCLNIVESKTQRQSEKQVIIEKGRSNTNKSNNVTSTSIGIYWRFNTHGFYQDGLLEAAMAVCVHG